VTGTCPQLAEDELPSDEELCALALAGSPDAELPADAVPLEWVMPRATASLPAWYMPALAAGRLAGGRRVVVVTLVAVLVALEALGLCSVFGQVVIG